MIVNKFIFTCTYHLQLTTCNSPLLKCIQISIVQLVLLSGLSLSSSELVQLVEYFWPCCFIAFAKVSSLTNHDFLQGEEGSGHAATDKLSLQQNLAVTNEICAHHGLLLLLWSGKQSVFST